MGYRSSKHRTVQSLSMTLNGGINVAVAGTNIADNQMQECVNFWYENTKTYLTTRPGIAAVTGEPLTVNDAPRPLEKIHYYVKDANNAWMVAVAGGSLWYLDSGAWIKIGDLYAEAVIPHLITYGGKLIVADGDVSLKAWAGQTAEWSDVVASGYVSATKLTQSGDKTSVYYAAWEIKADCGVDGDKSCTIVSVEYDSGTNLTTITVTGDAITSNLVGISTGRLNPIIGSPQYATALTEIGGRLVANSRGSGEWDAVYFSGQYDETMWNTVSPGTAVSIRAGYKDALIVQGFGVIGTDLIVFKGGAGKRVYRISTAGSPTNWTVQLLATNSTASEADAVALVINDLVFGDDKGLKSLSQVQTYGDLSQGLLGTPVASLLNGKTTKELRFLQSLDMMFALYSGTPDIYVYHPTNAAFTVCNFGDVQINSVIDTGQDIYLAGQNGYLYILTTDDKDELTPDVFTEISCRLKTKNFTFPGDVIVRRSRVYADVITVNQGNLSAIGRDNFTETALLSWVPVGVNYIYDANHYIYDADEYIGGASIGYTDSRARWRDSSLAFAINMSKGRVNIKNINTELALVTG